MRPSQIAAPLVLAALGVWRAAALEAEIVDFALMLGGVALFLVVQAVLLALRVGDGVRVVVGYLATFYFGNRLLAEVWLGPDTELSSGTVAPLLLGDLVMLEVIVRRRLWPPAALGVVALAALVPVLGLLDLPGASLPAFAYQYAAILRVAVVTWSLAALARRSDDPTGSADACVTWAGAALAACGVLTGAASFLLEQRVGLPGWGQNVYANALAVTAAYFGWRALEGGRRTRLNLAIVIGAVVGIVGTGTRVALLVVVVALVWPLITRLVARRLTFFSNALVGLVMAAVLAGFTGPLLLLASELNPRFASIGGLRVTADTDIGDLVAAVGNESSFRTRLSLWQASLAMAAERPLTGVGWGQWNWQKGNYGVPFEVMLDPHNGFVWALAEGGIAGLAVVYGALVVFVLALRASPATLAVVLALLLEVMNANLQKPLFGVLIAVLLARALVQRRAVLTTGRPR